MVPIPGWSGWGFAAGALLTMIADELAPAAYRRSSVSTGLATTAGFILAMFVGTLDSRHAGGGPL
jgi:zinc transporter ZupT